MEQHYICFEQFKNRKNKMKEIKWWDKEGKEREDERKKRVIEFVSSEDTEEFHKVLS